MPDRTPKALITSKPSNASQAPTTSKDDTRSRIIEAALTTLREEGIAGASARAIARAGGFNQALIFYHFGSVHELLLAAVDVLSARRVERYTKRIEGITTLRELVAVATELHHEDSLDGHITVLSQMLAGATTSPELKAPLRERFEPWVGLVDQAIRRVIEKTAFASVVPVDDLAFAVTGLFMGLELMTGLEDDSSRADRLFASIGMLAGLLETFMGQIPPPEAGK
jgi:AcrR family transcriptional regulator